MNFEIKINFNRTNGNFKNEKLELNVISGHLFLKRKK